MQITQYIFHETFSVTFAKNFATQNVSKIEIDNARSARFRRADRFSFEIRAILIWFISDLFESNHSVYFWILNIIDSMPRSSGNVTSGDSNVASASRKRPGERVRLLRRPLFPIFYLFSFDRAWWKLFLKIHSSGNVGKRRRSTERCGPRAARLFQ